MVSKIQRRTKIKARIRGKISGTAARPRMSVFRSNKQIYVQLIDDLAGTTLCASSSRASKRAPSVKSQPRLARLSLRKLLQPVSPKWFSTATATFSMAELNHWLTPPATVALNSKEYGY